MSRRRLDSEARSVSLICIHAHGIPDVFPSEALREAGAALRDLLGAGLAGLEPLNEMHLAEPVVGDEDDVIPIEELVFRGFLQPGGTELENELDGVHGVGGIRHQRQPDEGDD